MDEGRGMLHEQQGQTDDLEGESPTDQTPFRVGLLDEARWQPSGGEDEEEETEEGRLESGLASLSCRLIVLRPCRRFVTSPVFHTPREEVNAEEGDSVAIAVLGVHPPFDVQVAQEANPEPNQ